MKQIKFSRDASRELEEAAAWYEKEQPGLGRRLITSVENALELLSETNAPLTPVAGSAGRMGAKKLLLHKFPFSLILIETEDGTIVIAMAHHSRKPGYWKSRIDP